jgi:uncharacterized membrane protein
MSTITLILSLLVYVVFTILATVVLITVKIILDIAYLIAVIWEFLKDLPRRIRRLLP